MNDTNTHQYSLLCNPASDVDVLHILKSWADVIGKPMQGRGALNLRFLTRRAASIAEAVERSSEYMAAVLDTLHKNPKAVRCMQDNHDVLLPAMKLSSFMCCSVPAARDAAQALCTELARLRVPLEAYLSADAASRLMAKHEFQGLTADEVLCAIEAGAAESRGCVGAHEEGVDVELNLLKDMVEAAMAEVNGDTVREVVVLDDVDMEETKGCDGVPVTAAALEKFKAVLGMGRARFEATIERMLEPDAPDSDDDDREAAARALQHKKVAAAPLIRHVANLEFMLKLADVLAQTAAEAGMQRTLVYNNVLPHLYDMAKRAVKVQFVAPIRGIVGSGKSTFLKALVGASLLPSDVGACTAIPVCVAHTELPEPRLVTKLHALCNKHLAFMVKAWRAVREFKPAFQVPHKLGHDLLCRAERLGADTFFKPVYTGVRDVRDAVRDINTTIRLTTAMARTPDCAAWFRDFNSGLDLVTMEHLPRVEACFPILHGKPLIGEVVVIDTPGDGEYGLTNALATASGQAAAAVVVLGSPDTYEMARSVRLLHEVTEAAEGKSKLLYVLNKVDVLSEAGESHDEIKSRMRRWLDGCCPEVFTDGNVFPCAAKLAVQGFATHEVIQERGGLDVMAAKHIKDLPEEVREFMKNEWGRSWSEKWVRLAKKGTEKRAKKLRALLETSMVDAIKDSNLQSVIDALTTAATSKLLVDVGRYFLGTSAKLVDTLHNLVSTQRKLVAKGCVDIGPVLDAVATFTTNLDTILKDTERAGYAMEPLVPAKMAVDPGLVARLQCHAHHLNRVLINKFADTKAKSFPSLRLVARGVEASGGAMRNFETPRAARDAMDPFFKAAQKQMAVDAAALREAANASLRATIANLIATLLGKVKGSTGEFDGVETPPIVKDAIRGVLQAAEVELDDSLEVAEQEVLDTTHLHTVSLETVTRSHVVGTRRLWYYLWLKRAEVVEHRTHYGFSEDLLMRRFLQWHASSLDAYRTRVFEVVGFVLETHMKDVVNRVRNAVKNMCDVIKSAEQLTKDAEEATRVMAVTEERLERLRGDVVRAVENHKVWAKE